MVKLMVMQESETDKCERKRREVCDMINTMMSNGVTVSSRTVPRKLGEEGLVGRIAAKKTLLKEKSEMPQICKRTKEIDEGRLV